MTARSASDLAADVREALETLPEMPFTERSPDGDEQARNSMRTVAGDGIAALAEVVARLEAAEADARAVREKMHHNAANLDFAIKQRQELEAQVAALTQERDAARLVPPLVRSTLEKGLRLDMTKPPVTQAELRAAIDLLPDSPAFYSSVSGMERLAAAEAALADTRRALETFRDSYDIWRNGCDEAHLDLAYDAACRVLAATGGGTFQGIPIVADPDMPEGTFDIRDTGQEQQP